MKLAKHYLNQVAAADELQSIAFVIFFALFIGIVIFIVTGNKKAYRDHGNLPLEDEFASNIENNHKTD
jgi:cbb3-type cytochrome oxidase subunit 3